MKDHDSIIGEIKRFFARDGRILKVWVFGSFARQEDGPLSDIDIAVEDDQAQKFSYFDLADVQYQLEKILRRKVDIGFIQSLAPAAAENAVLIYEKP